MTLYSYKITTGADTITGSKGRDVIAANSGNDVVYGQSGNDTLHGEGGSDKLYGGSGTDNLFGEDGNDWLSGDTGWDTLTGGRGSDIFAVGNVWGTDTITDFKHGADKIDMKGVANLTAYSQLAITQSGADTKIGFGGDYLILKGVGTASIDAADFILN